MTSQRTVVVTGIGAITPLGTDAPSTWQAMLAGKSGITPIEADWADSLDVRIAGQITLDLQTVLDRVQMRRMDRFAQLGVIAATQAWKDAGFQLVSALTDSSNGLDPDRVGVTQGTAIGGLNTIISQWEVLKEKGPRRVTPFLAPMLMPNSGAAHIGLLVGARAGVHTPVSACASGSEAIAIAMDMIRSDQADVVIAGGAESILHPLPLAAFGVMRAASRLNEEPTRASRPWDVDRDGFVFAEGATSLVLESLEHAQARHAHIYGTVLGAGISADAFDMVKPDQSGQELALRRALVDADVKPAEIVHINAHATSTPAGDLTEAYAIRNVLGDDTDHVVVTSTKSMVGHLLGAAGALETMAALLALCDRMVPPTINLDNPEHDLPIDVAANVSRPLPSTGRLVALNNSFGFGGHNACVVVSNDNQRN